MHLKINQLTIEAMMMILGALTLEEKRLRERIDAWEEKEATTNIELDPGAWCAMRVEYNDLLKERKRLFDYVKQNHPGRLEKWCQSFETPMYKG